MYFRSPRYIFPFLSYSIWERQISPVFVEFRLYNSNDAAKLFLTRFISSPLGGGCQGGLEQLADLFLASKTLPKWIRKQNQRNHLVCIIESPFAFSTSVGLVSKVVFAEPSFLGHGARVAIEESAPCANKHRNSNDESTICGILRKLTYGERPWMESGVELSEWLTSCFTFTFRFIRFHREGSRYVGFW